MRHYQKFFLIFIFLGFFFFLPSLFVLAQSLEIEYPMVAGSLPPSTTKTLLPDYIKYLFNLALVIAGLIAFASLVYGGFRYLASAGNPTAMSDARGQITAGILGLFLLLGAYLILITINPQLTILKTGDITVKQGVILYTQSNCPGRGSPTGTEGEDYGRQTRTSSSLRGLREEDWSRDIRSIYFYNGSEELEVTLYSEENYGGTSQKYDTQGEDICCPGPGCQMPINARSIKLTWKIPGVYLYAEKDCEGNIDFPDPLVFVGNTDFGYLNFHDKAQSLKIYPTVSKQIECDLNNPACTFFPVNRCTGPDAFPQCQIETETVVAKFGAILHEHSNFQGDAEVFFGGGEDPEDTPRCYNLPIADSSCDNTAWPGPYCREHVNKVDVSSPDGLRTSSITIFKQLLSNQEVSGDGVILYSNYNWNEEDDPGEDNVFCGPFKPDDRPQWIYFDTPSEGDRTSGEVFDGVRLSGCEYVLGAKRGSSIRVDGNFIAVLFRDDGRGEVFRSRGDYRLKGNHIGNDKAEYMLVIPIAPG